MREPSNYGGVLGLEGEEDETSSSHHGEDQGGLEGARSEWGNPLLVSHAGCRMLSSGMPCSSWRAAQQQACIETLQVDSDKDHSPFSAGSTAQQTAQVACSPCHSCTGRFGTQDMVL
jgi:hypothetical protein